MDTHTWGSAMTQAKPHPRSRWGPWIVLGLTICLMAIGRVMEYRALGEPPDGWVLDSIMGLAFVSFPAVGALIASRRPGHRYGWFLVVIGAVAALLIAATGYSNLRIGIQGIVDPVAVIAAWIAQWAWFPLVISVATFVFLWFPTGTVPSHRWRGVERGVFVAIAVVTLPSMFQGRLRGEDFAVDNPIGISAIRDGEALVAPVFLVVLFLGVMSLLSLVFRYRGAGTEERQQIKWVALAAMAFTFGLATGDVLGVSDALFPLALIALPVTIAISILRYRLYDIDLIINRTLVYAALTTTLLGSYLVTVFALSRVLDPVTRDSDIAVAASTLAVAALFRPVRARIQGFIDRRFYRRKYDTARAVGDFAARLRDEVELELVRSDVLGVVGTTLQPRHASLWLKAERP